MISITCSASVNRSKHSSIRINETRSDHSIRYTRCAGRRTILDGISFRLNAGEHLAVTGNSGSGKTALARVLAGMLFSQGKIEYQQADSSKSIRIAYMPPSETWKNNSNVSDFYYQQRFNYCDPKMLKP